VANTIIVPGRNSRYNGIVKVTKEQAAKNRRALVRAASKLFRERGIDGVGVADISKEAGLTHGALYAQFASKEELAAEALKDGLERGRDWLIGHADGADSPISAYLDAYLSKTHRDQMSRGCSIAASASELARQDKKMSGILAGGIAGTVELFESSLGKSPLKASARERAIAIAVSEIGALAIARALAKGDPKFSEEVLSATRKVLGEIAGEKR
jgi:TetR/AcrR family transcriptional regulator, transcriptional repressor for nem operon